MSTGACCFFLTQKWPIPHPLTKAIPHDYLSCSAVPPRQAISDRSPNTFLSSASDISPRYLLIHVMFHSSFFIMVKGNSNLSSMPGTSLSPSGTKATMFGGPQFHFASSSVTFATNFSAYSWLENVLPLFSCRLPQHPEATGSLMLSLRAFSW